MLGYERRRDPTDAATVVGESRDIPADRLQPNDWNPNVMTDEEADKLRRGIRRFGFVQPLTVRPWNGVFQIIDGEHRWEIGVEEGIEVFPCWVIDVDDDTARMLTPILNELHGSPDTQKLGALLKDLQDRHSETELRALMPFSRTRFDELIGTISVDWEALEQKRRGADEVEDRWVERVLRMPLEAANVYDAAIERMKEDAGADAPDWRAVELICSDYLAGR